MSSGVTAHGARALKARAAGTRITLLTADPLATAHTTGSSRLALMPETCWALSARSSPSTPAVFRAATLVSKATSSSPVAMSSSRANRVDGTVVPNQPHRHADRRRACRTSTQGAMAQEGSDLTCLRTPAPGRLHIRSYLTARLGWTSPHAEA